MGTLNTFLQTFKGGFIHPNLFKVTLSGWWGSSTYGDLLTHACKTATIPGVTYTENKFYHDGYFNKFVSGADYDPFTLIFMVDGGESQVIKCFDEWSKKIFDDGKFGYQENYVCDIKFEIFNRDGTVAYTTEIIDAYPTNISPIELSFDSNDEILEYPISFNFKKFKTN